ncbi:MAG: type I-B CRISPR-associated protein Cas7/Csh2 [Bacteroidota bacterium]
MLQTNRDFLFLYEARHTNPNGDPDNENKPRMDQASQRNLVSDVRLKRYIRDYFIQQDKPVFVDMVGDSKVTMDSRLEYILREYLPNKEKMRSLLSSEDDYEAYENFREKSKDLDHMIKDMINDKTKVKELNQAVLSGLVREEFIDVRMFGSAFAIKGFNRAITGPIQLAWGYSLNKAHMLQSNTISSIMNDDSSTFGRDHRIKYSLIAFQGTINAAAARYTGLSEDDLNSFREAIWAAVSATPTRSKMNQYPLLYLELEYENGTPNGHLGDLRRYVKSKPKAGVDDKQVDGLEDLEIDFSALHTAKKDSGISNVTERVSSRLGYNEQP